MQIVDKQVAILGGGCAALWLLYELSRRGYEALLIDHHMIGKFASTRNQSWLHSGALYATSQLEKDKVDPSLLQIAEACKAEFSRIRGFCEQYAPDAIDRKSRCLFLFSDRQQAHQAAARLSEIDIPYRELDSSAIIKREPGLFAYRRAMSLQTEPKAGFETDDFPFDSNAILGAVARQATKAGGGFLQSQCELNELRFSTRDGLWEIEDSQHKIRAQICVCASGALIPQFSEMFEPNARNREPFHIQKCVVAVLHKRICTNIVVFRDQLSGFLNLAPFEWGTSANMGGNDKTRASVADLLIPPKSYKEFAEKLSLFAPGISQQIPIECHFYVCQKLGNVNDSSHPRSSFGYRHYFWREEDDNFFVFYPGKFTLSWAAARSMADVLAGRLELRTTSGTPVQVADPPPISPRPYFGSASHTLQRDERGEIQIV